MKNTLKKQVTVFSLFLSIVACKPVVEKNIEENILMDKNTAKMVDLGDTIRSGIVAVKVYFPDSICGVFALDNGMIDRCVMDSVFFNRILTHYPLNQKQGIFSKVGRKNIEEYEGKIEFDLCNQKISTKQIFVISGFSQQNFKLDGLIGSDFFVDNIIEINYDNRMVSVLDSVGEKAKGYATITLLKRESLPNCRDMYITLPKIGKQRIHFDLGYFGSIRITYSMWEALGLDTNRYLRKWICQSLQNAPETAYISMIDSIHIGNLMVKNPLVVTQLFEHTKRFDMLEWTNDYQGILGQEFLSQYNIIIDYQKDKLYLKKRTD